MVVFTVYGISSIILDQLHEKSFLMRTNQNPSR
jgi:hypothetical protein